ncbi:hypothetical protein F5X99DRAFT_381206 [Biscogniauxia marginata]|nr:hypothetical protein F5X99DRAFT_381206 [Biscogniauxia marginata]
METICLPNACASCRDNNVICELSLTGLGPAIPGGCVECMNAGEGCFIPICDSMMMSNGIPTASVGQRSCLRCALSQLSCLFPSGARPLPCLSCMLTQELWCEIPPPSVVNTWGPTAAYYDSCALSNADLHLLHGEQSDGYMSYLDSSIDEQIGESFCDLGASAGEIYPEVCVGNFESEPSFDDHMFSWDVRPEFQVDSEPPLFIPFEQGLDGQGDVETALPSPPPTPSLVRLAPRPCSPLDLGEPGLELSEADALSDEEYVLRPAQDWVACCVLRNRVHHTQSF